MALFCSIWVLGAVSPNLRAKTPDKQAKIPDQQAKMSDRSANKYERWLCFAQHAFVHDNGNKKLFCGQRLKYV